MRLGIFSDVHGNLEALISFQEAVREEKLDRLFCLGDSIGYGPNPNECLELLRSVENLSVLMGNHEWAAQNLDAAKFVMNPLAYRAIVWTAARLTRVNWDYIRNLPLGSEFDHCCFFHASAHCPENWDYVRSGDCLAIRLCLEFSPQRIVFVGHTHQAALLDAGCDDVLPCSLFSDGTTYKDPGLSSLIVNPGSIGQPRGGLRSPSFVIYDSGTGTITWRRIAGYDPTVTAQKILSTSLPSKLAYFLSNKFQPLTRGAT